MNHPKKRKRNWKQRESLLKKKRDMILRRSSKIFGL
jgi:hypothetical protein